jgi:hypothetical protein
MTFHQLQSIHSGVGCHFFCSTIVLCAMLEAARLLDGVRIGVPRIVAAGVVVYPLHGVGSLLRRDSITLHEAYRLGAVTITEHEQSRRVSALDVTVHSDLPVLIPEGEVLRGGLQNRTVHITLLLPHGRHTIPVSCVEQGRWSPGRIPVMPPHRTHPARPVPQMHASNSKPHRSEFDPVEFLAPVSVRAAKMYELSRRGRGDSVQAAVWDRVRQRLRRERIDSSTGDLSESMRREDIAGMLDRLTPLPDQIGVLIAIGRAYYAVEYFDCPDVWASVHQRVLGSYFSDASLARSISIDPVLSPRELARFFKHMLSRVRTSPGPDDTSGVTLEKAPAGVGTHMKIAHTELHLDPSIFDAGLEALPQLCARKLSGLAFHANDRLRHVALFVEQGI